MEKFRPKINLLFVLTLSVIFGLILAGLFYNKNWIGFSFILFAIGIFILMFWTTYYIIEDQKLKIKFCFLYNFSIEIQNIKKISQMLIHANLPAFSYIKLEIFYNKFDRILIAPKDETRFIEAVKRINPEIEIESRI
ncbi:PH domain-containing protein [Flavobacterium reichenbachii]|uniref:PH domain-containing protein n=1 Tax=Flavobacterium reichenbachii TaxID=362418 RepID=UPI00068A302D|nr:PH domain-containing protein [Flavobacterium reichenbachii]OXB17604.1 hypothetical protein B0A68_04755 [Flavobacterium reichenbachii]